MSWEWLARKEEEMAAHSEQAAVLAEARAHRALESVAADTAIAKAERASAKRARESARWMWAQKAKEGQ